MNDLDLVLQAPDGTTYLGNNFVNGLQYLVVSLTTSTTSSAYVFQPAQARKLVNG